MSPPEQCSECGREFSTTRGLKTHKGKVHDPLPKEKLVELYIRQNLSAREISEQVDVSHRGVKSRLSKHDLWGKDPVKHRLITDDGYPVLSHTGVDGRGRRVRVHRLVAIADGADPAKVFSGEYDVHHVNGMKIDNRPDNIEVLAHDEHAKLHNNPKEAADD